MAQFDELTEVALGNFGLVTASQAREIGIRSKDIAEWVRLGRLERLGWGVYRIEHYVPTNFDRYAQAVAIVGRDAIVWGESVLAMLNLALVNPLQVTVATARRNRKKLPEWIHLLMIPQGTKATSIEGVPSQPLADAIRICRGRIMTDRLADAVREAERRGFLGIDDAHALTKEFFQ